MVWSQSLPLYPRRMLGLAFANLIYSSMLLEEISVGWRVSAPGPSSGCITRTTANLSSARLHLIGNIHTAVLRCISAVLNPRMTYSLALARSADATVSLRIPPGHASENYVTLKNKQCMWLFLPQSVANDWAEDVERIHFSSPMTSLSTMDTTLTALWNTSFRTAFFLRIKTYALPRLSNGGFACCSLRVNNRTLNRRTGLWDTEEVTLSFAP